MVNNNQAQKKIQNSLQRVCTHVHHTKYLTHQYLLLTLTKNGGIYILLIAKF